MTSELTAGQRPTDLTGSAAHRGQRTDRTTPTEGQIRVELDKICAHSTFAKSKTLRRFLRFTVEETLAGRAGDLKEYVVALSALGRGQNFDPRHSSIVRSQARNLRMRLDEYYRETNSPLLVAYQPGGYAPEFSWKVAETAKAAPAVEEVRAEHHYGRERHPAWTQVCVKAKALRHTAVDQDLAEAIRLLEELGKTAPDFGLGIAELSLCHSLRQLAELRLDVSEWARAKALAVEAVGLAPECGEAWTALGVVKLIYDRDFDAANDCLVRASNLERMNGLALAGRALWHLRRSEFREASALAGRATAAAPNDVMVSVCKVLVNFCQHDYPEALKELILASHLSPDAKPVQMIRPFVKRLSGMIPNAFDAAKRAGANSEWIEAWLQIGQGRPEQAVDLLASPEGAVRMQDADWFAVLLLTALGRNDQATSLISRAVRKRLPYTLLLRQDPVLNAAGDGVFTATAVA